MTQHRDTMKKATLAAAVALTMSGSAQAGENPFAVQEMASGYMQVAMAEGKCGEGKCGNMQTQGATGQAKQGMEGKCGEGKCGNMQQSSAGQSEEGSAQTAPAAKKAKPMEGKCGEGKCGNMPQQAAGQAHTGGSQTVPAAKGKPMEGKCGEGKCGGMK